MASAFRHLSGALGCGALLLVSTCQAQQSAITVPPSPDQSINSEEFRAAVLGGDVNKVASLIQQNPQQVNENLPGLGAPLVTAVLCGAKDDVAILLVTNHADLEARDAAGRTALYCAVARGDAPLAEFLLNHKAEVNGANPDLPVKNWLAPLDLAVTGDSPEVVRLLLAHGANIHTQAANAGNLFHSWATHGNAAIAEQILAAGCDINGLDRDGRTPLEVAAKNNQLPAMQWLVDHHAQVNIADKNGLTPLYFAAQASSWDGLAVALLLSHQADPNIIDKDGMTPLLFATRYGVKESVEALLEHGANVNATDRAGRTALSMAEKGEHHSFERRLDYHDIAVLLRAQGAKEPSPVVPSNQ